MKAEDLAKEIKKELKTFAETEARAMKDVEKKAAKMGVKRLKVVSPKNKGRYRKAWTHKKTAEKADKISLVIHNREKFNITHLLENGHMGIVHGQRIGRVKEFPHIKGVEEEVEEFIEKELGKKL